MKATAKSVMLAAILLLAAGANPGVGITNAVAVEAIDVPTSLFGVSVGREYTLGEPGSGSVGTLPVKSVIRVVEVGPGIDYYFEPKKVDSEFASVRSDEASPEAMSGSSFKARFYPVIPATVTTVDELKAVKSKLSQRVASVEWTKEMPTKTDATYKVIDLCETFLAGFGKRPVFERTAVGYSCRFVSGDYEFQVGNTDDYVFLTLALRDDIRTQLEEDTDTTLRRLQAKRLLQQ